MENTFSTGIPALDDALEPHLAPGNLILSAGLTGGGKTILAGQLGATMSVLTPLPICLASGVTS